MHLAASSIIRILSKPVRFSALARESVRRRFARGVYSRSAFNEAPSAERRRKYYRSYRETVKRQ